VTTAGNFAQWYLADPGLRNDGPTASIITFFSSGVRSRWPTLPPAKGGGASLDAAGVGVAVGLVAQPESAKPVASGTTTLKLDRCKARSSDVAAEFLPFCLITVANVRQLRGGPIAEGRSRFANAAPRPHSSEKMAVRKGRLKVSLRNFNDVARQDWNCCRYGKVVHAGFATPLDLNSIAIRAIGRAASNSEGG
jgi:hypothetical protein